MRDTAAFEALLARSLVEHARLVDRPFDPRAIAQVATLGHRTAAQQAFGALRLRTQLLLVGLVALLTVGLAIAGARLLEPKPFGWGTTLYLLTDRQPAAGTSGGPFLLSVQVGADEAPRLRLALDAAARDLPSGLQLEGMSPSGRFALLTTHTGLPPEDSGIRVVVDTADGSVDTLPSSLGAVWAPAGDRLAWLARGPSGQSITVLDAASGRSREVFTVSGGFDPIMWTDEATLMVDEWYSVGCPVLLPGCWANDDGTFQRAESTTWQVPVDGGAPAEVERPGSIAGWRGGGDEVAVSPDRALVAYFVEDTSQLVVPAFPRATSITVWVHAPDGSDARPLATFDRPIDGPFAPAEFEQTVWSADSRTFSWAMLGRLWVVSVDGVRSAQFDLAELLADAGAGQSATFTWRLP